MVVRILRAPLLEMRELVREQRFPHTLFRAFIDEVAMSRNGDREDDDINKDADGQALAKAYLSVHWFCASATMQ